MLGLVVLFFLGLWVLITLGATLLARKLGRKFFNKKGGTIGAIIGFMLTMGGWLIYWAGEYVYTQYTVTKLCDSEGGLTVYVTPEQWREQIGEEEWATLTEDWKNIDHDLEFKFNGTTYYGSTQLNRRVLSYQAEDKRKDLIGDIDQLFIDKETNQVLIRKHYFSVSTGGFYKPWLNSINDCYGDSWSRKERFFHREYTNYSTIKGNKNVK